MSWSSAQYSKFEAERNRPIDDLLARLPDAEICAAVDLGCGPGNSTERLQACFPGAVVVGIDNAPDMIAAARRRMPTTRFELADIATWSDPGPFDVILANASLQWVPDHETLLPNLVSRLEPGGRLAIQTPDNLDEPAHVLMREIAALGLWAGKLAHVAESLPPRPSAEWYHRNLRNQVGDLDVWRTTYFHPLAGGVSAIVEWFKGTGLRPFLDPLDEEERTVYLSRYEAALASVYPAFPDGSVLLPFPRLFTVATR